MILSIVLFVLGSEIIASNYLCVIYKQSLIPLLGCVLCCVGIWLFPVGIYEFFDTWRAYFYVLPFVVDPCNPLIIQAVLIGLKILPEPEYPPKK